MIHMSKNRKCQIKNAFTTKIKNEGAIILCQQLKV